MMTTKHILLFVTLLTQCLALHALTEEDIATLDALTENDFTVPNFTGTPQW